MSSPRDRRKTEEAGSLHCKSTLIIVPCGAQKVWHKKPQTGKAPAKEAYTSQLFKVHREYAEAFASAWLILSARYGLTNPDQLIENYDFKFDRSDIDPKNWWRLRRMIQQAQSLPSYNKVVLLGGKLYREIAQRVFRGIFLPYQIVEPFAHCDLPATIRSARHAVARTMGLTDRVYRLQQRLREQPLSLTIASQEKKRARLLKDLIQAAREDGCLSKISPALRGRAK